MLTNYQYKMKEVLDVNSPLFVDAMGIYIDSFPIDERQSLNTIIDRIKLKKERLFVYEKDSNVIGFCLIWDFVEIKTYFIDYYAIKRESRGSGLGTTFLNSIIEILDSNYSIVLEVEKPINDEDLLKIKRINFYNQLSFKSINNFNYVMPSMNGFEYLEMIIMTYNREKKSVLEIEYLNKLVKTIFQNVYPNSIYNSEILESNNQNFYELT